MKPRTLSFAAIAEVVHHSKNQSVSCQKQKSTTSRNVGSDFEFEADLHDLRAWDLEIGARPLGIMMHECEELFAPTRHARSPAGSYNRLMARVVGHALEVAAFDFSVGRQL